MPFKFAIDEKGNYGYIKNGETVVTPFWKADTAIYYGVITANSVPALAAYKRVAYVHMETYGTVVMHIESYFEVSANVKNNIKITDENGNILIEKSVTSDGLQLVNWELKFHTTSAQKVYVEVACSINNPSQSIRVTSISATVN